MIRRKIMRLLAKAGSKIYRKIVDWELRIHGVIFIGGFYKLIRKGVLPPENSKNWQSLQVPTSPREITVAPVEPSTDD